MPFKCRQTKLAYMRRYNQRRRDELSARSSAPSAPRASIPLPGRVPVTIRPLGGGMVPAPKLNVIPTHPPMLHSQMCSFCNGTGWSSSSARCTYCQKPRVQPSFTPSGDIDTAKLWADEVTRKLLLWALAIGGVALVIWLCIRLTDSSSSAGAAILREWPWEEWVPKV